MQKITPFLWFNANAEEAVEFYVSTFANSRILSTSRYGDAGPGPKGSLMVATFRLEGQEFMAINGGPTYRLTPAISLLVNCETQAEVDALWDKLAVGGAPQQCGWVQDKFGLSWQIIPSVLGRLMGDKDPKKAGSVMQAMLKMHKIDIAALKRAYEAA